jgi:parvulin-like peptidyl-prolyl isomerase
MKLLGLSILILALGCGPGGSDDSWVAKVDGAEIPGAELQRLVDKRLEDSPDANRDDVVTEELNRLVSEQVVLNYAAKAGVTVSDAELAARLRSLHGEEWKDDDLRYREAVRREMIVDRAVIVELAPRARVAETALQAYYDEHRAEYLVPERAQVRQIVVEERAKAEELHARLTQGADFASLARANSLAPEAAAGGELPPFARGELPEAFDRAFELEPGQISPVIESPYGFHVFLLESKLPPAEPTFEELRAKLEAELGQRHLEELRRDWLRSLRKAAEIQTNDRFLESLR